MREDFTSKTPKLRSGYTTGSCATAASVMALRKLLTGRVNGNDAQVTINLPRGKQAHFAPSWCHSLGHSGLLAEAAVQKDAGDDPDVTHQALIIVRIHLEEQQGIRFQAGEGVGNVTLAGLPIPPGEAAINPVPRRMIIEHLQQETMQQGYQQGLTVTVGVENGIELAKRTTNARLGIIGGLSILGTTGIVRPFSCAAYIASIRQALEVLHSNGGKQVFLCTGSTSEAIAKQHLAASEIQRVECGDFVGTALKHADKLGFDLVTVVAGFGKMSKLAAGHGNLHHRWSQVEPSVLAKLAQNGGATAQTVTDITHSHSAGAILALCQSANFDIATIVCNAARQHILERLNYQARVEVVAVSQTQGVVGTAN